MTREAQHRACVARAARKPRGTRGAVGRIGAATLLSVCLSASLAHSTPVRGIPRSLDAAYAGADGQFRCLDGSATLPIARVNDDFCDCADGSDEPGTSACSNGRFYCANKGYRGKFIPSSQVNDGVCDCCDGTDETGPARPGAAACKNTCDVDGAEWRRTQADAIQRAETGARLREEYASAGKAAAAERTKKITSATTALEAAKAEKASAEAAVAAAEEEERRVNKERADALAATGDAALAAALRIAQMERAELLRLLFEHVRETNTSEALVNRLRARSPLPGGAATADDIKWEDPYASQAAEFKSEAGHKARDRLATARTEETRLDSELRAANDESSLDFGPDAVFYKLKGPCFDLRVNNQYTYTACPFGTARQDSTSLGTFAGWGKNADGSTNYGEMTFSNGQMCWNGPARSLKLVFECGATDALLSMDEPEKCTYSGRFSTPAACDGKFARELKLELEDASAHVKDEL